MKPNILLCTVGTGTADELFATLISPLKKSITLGEWNRVILLPSQLTRENAELLKCEIAEVPIETRALPEPGLEDNPDACFDYFNGVIGELLASGARPDLIMIDFTRGTKAMSAALLVAAIRNDIPIVRYIVGNRDNRGSVIPGTEVVKQFNTSIALILKRFDEARILMATGNFAAVVALIRPYETGDATSNSRTVQIRAILRLCEFYAAWDRLDHRSAHEIDLANPTGLPEDFRRFSPSSEQRAWVAELAEPLPESFPDRATRLRKVMVDLFENGLRRIEQHQFEDSLLRAYRVLELIGQVRLFDLGFDSAAIDPGHPKIVEFQQFLAKKKSAPLTSDRKNGFLQAPREKVGRLLKHLGDDLGQELIRAAERGDVKANTRNYSILIHGFEAKAGAEAEPLRELYSTIQGLIELDQGEPFAKLAHRTARFAC